MIDPVRVKEPFSDHNILTCDMSWCRYRLKSGERDIMIARENMMRTLLRDYDGEQAFQNTDVNTKWDHFKAVVNSAVQRCVPISIKKRNRKLRRMSKRAELARRKKYHIWKRYREIREYL